MLLRNTLFLLSLGLFWGIISCQMPNAETKKACSIAGQFVQSTIQKMISQPCKLEAFQTITIAGHEVDIALPDSGVAYAGNLIILQGYNFRKHDWCEKAPELCQKARAAGYVLIMPEMGKSVYSSQFYEETRADLQEHPKRNWLVDTVFSYLQKEHCLLLPSQNNYLLGLSTGGRGVALIALDKPELFAAAASLSGDFDQSQMPTDKLMANYYGPFEQFAQRWKEEDNVIFRIKDWQTPIYLGHGQLDKIVPPQQTRQFYDSLRVHQPELPVELNEPQEHAHDYLYWASETDAVLNFFGQFKK